VLAKIASANTFRNYSIQVFGNATNTETSNTYTASGIVAVVRNDTTNGRQTITRGELGGPGLALTDPIFSSTQPG